MDQTSRAVKTEGAGEAEAGANQYREAEPRTPIPVSPIDDIYVDYLLSRKRETPDVDFKLVIDVSRYGFPEVAKDIFAFANYGGGYIVIGFKQRETGGFEPVGLPEGFHIDQADLQQKFNAYCGTPIALGYREFDRPVDGQPRRFSLIYVPPSPEVLVPTSDGIVRAEDGKEKRVFHRGQILIRRGTQSIGASPVEVGFIKKRAEESEYQIALVTGNPDRLRETLSSNLFEVRLLPRLVFSAKLFDTQIPFSAELAAPFVDQNQDLIAFENPADGPLRGIIDPGTVHQSRIEEWLRDEDKRSVLLWLFDKCLIWEARQRGMYLQRQGKKLFYPLRAGETTRIERWPGMARESDRQVATMMYASQLGEKVGVHAAVSIHFTWLGGKLYLRLSPSYVLTEDGRHPRRGEREGSVITRLSHDDYNKLYLRNLFFWVSKLGGTEGKLVLAGGHLVVDSSPVSAEMEVGLRADGPGLEAPTSEGASGNTGGEKSG